MWQFIHVNAKVDREKEKYIKRKIEKKIIFF